jgi:XTP/dITP diphosphohydrolase
LADPQGHVRADAEAYCHGRIAHEPRGTAGFGYDPLFEVIEYHRTFGELGDTVKSVLSHRGRAVRSILAQIVRLVRAGDWPAENVG